MKSFLTSLTILLGFVGAIAQGQSLAEINGDKMRTRTMYIAGMSTTLASNNGNVLLASTKKEVGNTNFEKGNQLPSGTSFLVTGVRILFDTTAAVTPLTATWLNNAPPVFMNGEIAVSQDGAGVLFSTSISDCTNFKASTGNDADFREIVPFKLRPDTNFQIVVSLAGAAAANQAYKIEFRGIEMIDSTKA